MPHDRIVLQFSTTQWTIPGFRWETCAARRKNYFSWIIRKMCHSPFSHVDFVLDDGNLLGASDMGDGSPLVEGNPRGVAIRPANYQQFGYRRRMVIRTNKDDAILAWARSQIGKPFDNGALYDFMSSKFPHARDWREPTAWFCAEYVVCAFEKGGYWGRDLNWPKTRVTPTDLVLLFITDPNFENDETFWEPVPELGMHPGEC